MQVVKMVGRPYDDQVVHYQLNYQNIITIHYQQSEQKDIRTLIHVLSLVFCDQSSLQNTLVTYLVQLMCTKINNSAYKHSWPCSTLVTFYLTFSEHLQQSQLG